MFTGYLNKLMQQKNAGSAWFETHDYIRWHPVAREGWLIFLLFAAIFVWIALSDLVSLTLGSTVVAAPVLVAILYILCFIKGRKA